MQLHERQQFDFLLLTAAERYVERLTQRNEGAANALQRLKADPNGDGVWLDEFVDAIFQDFLLENAAGASFILQALGKRKIKAVPEGKVEEVLVAMAKQVFGELLRSKTEEVLEQSVMYGGE